MFQYWVELSLIGSVAVVYLKVLYTFSNIQRSHTMYNIDYDNGEVFSSILICS